MRVALCLSGQVRNYKKSFDSQKLHLLDKLNPDVFIHTWSFKGKILPRHWVKEYNVEDYENHRIPENISPIEKILKDYKPQKILVEYPDNLFFMKKVEKSRQSNTYWFNGLMMWYSLYKSNELKKIHEKENSFTYDIVIRSRFDTFFEKAEFGDTFLEAIQNNVIYLSPSEDPKYKKTQTTEIELDSANQHPVFMQTDKFAYGNSHSMDYYHSIYEKFNENIDFYVHHNEEIISEHLWIKNPFKNVIKQNPNILFTTESW